MACVVKMKALKSSSEEESVGGGVGWGGEGEGMGGGGNTHKRPYMASSQGVLALAFNRLHWPNSLIQISGLGSPSAWTRAEPCGLYSHCLQTAAAHSTGLFL